MCEFHQKHVNLNALGCRHLLSGASPRSTTTIIILFIIFPTPQPLPAGTTISSSLHSQFGIANPRQRTEFERHKPFFLQWHQKRVCRSRYRTGGMAANQTLCESATVRFSMHAFDVIVIRSFKHNTDL